MTCLKFTFASCLLFAIFGPVPVVLFYSLMFWNMPPDGLIGAAYQVGAVPAVLFGAPTGVGLLGIAPFQPSLIADASLLRRILIAQLVGLTVFLLPLGGLMVNLGKMMLAGHSVSELEGTAVFFLFPTIVCASLVGCQLLPWLSRQAASGSQAARTRVQGP